MGRRSRFGGLTRARSLPALVLCLLASPALAQYIFLDSNGDGVRTAADLLSPRDTTRVSIWLVMDRDRDGVPYKCKPAGPVGTGYYTVVLHAINGDVAWGPFTEGASPNTIWAETPDSSFRVVKQIMPSDRPPPRLRLGSFYVVVKHGTPAIEMAYRCPIHPEEITSVQTACWKGPFGRNLVGLQYAGRANRPPKFVSLADAPIRAGTSQRGIMGATDGDGDPLTFRLVRGPSYVAVRTLNPGHGTAEGELVLAPDSCARGAEDCVIAVSDGTTSDFDTMRVKVLSIAPPLPTSPMQPSSPSPVVQAPTARSGIDADWIVGEWELNAIWVQSKYEVVMKRPDQVAFRRHVWFRRDGTVDMFQITQGGVDRALRSAYQIVDQEGGFPRLTVANWFGDSTASLDASNEGPTTLLLSYPWSELMRGHDSKKGGLYGRVPATQREGAPVDTAKLLDPLGTPLVQRDVDRDRVVLPEPMKTALRRHDPSFRVWEQSDAKGSAIDPSVANPRGPSAIVGDFDGDMLRDVALLGRSGADQVVVAVLSNFGIVRIVEVAWRRVRQGQGETESRGDPKDLRSVYLELAPRGTYNRFCWGRKAAPDVDAVGIVDAGGARFDYVLAGDRFELFAPAP